MKQHRRNRVLAALAVMATLVAVAFGLTQAGASDHVTRDAVHAKGCVPVFSYGANGAGVTNPTITYAGKGQAVCVGVTAYLMHDGAVGEDPVVVESFDLGAGTLPVVDPDLGACAKTNKDGLVQWDVSLNQDGNGYGILNHGWFKPTAPCVPPTAPPTTTPVPTTTTAAPGPSAPTCPPTQHPVIDSQGAMQCVPD